MEQSRFNEEQIIAVLKEQDVSMPTAEVAIASNNHNEGARLYLWLVKSRGARQNPAPLVE